LLDTAILIPLYPAREEPIAGISSEIIYNQMKCDSKYLFSPEETLEFLKSKHTEIVVTMGAGDIDRMTGKIIDILKNKDL